MIPNTEPLPFRGSYPKPVTFPKEKKGLNKAKKPTGELALFKIIASERKHICVKCSTKIRTLTVSNFHHVIPKSKSEEGRLDKDNIIIICDSCHYEIHNVAKDKHKKPPLTPQ